MSLNDAQAFAISLATTLIAGIVIFQAGDGAPRSSMRSILPPDQGNPGRQSGNPPRFPLPAQSIFSYNAVAPWWWWQA